MIGVAMRASATAACFVVLTAVCLLAQTSSVPPIPSQERFKPRTDLVATLRLSSDHVPVGRTPGVTLVLTNTGTRSLLVANRLGSFPAQMVRLFESDGEAIQPRSSSVCQCLIIPGPVKSLLRIQPQFSQEFVLWKDGEPQPYILPVGEYRVQVTYRNYADSPAVYDVYEKDADLAWDGQLVASAAFRVDSLSAAEETRLLADLSGPDQTRRAASVGRLGLGRVSAATDGLIDLFERSPKSQWRDVHLPIDIIDALGYIGTDSAARRLGDALERLPIESVLLSFFWSSPWHLDAITSLVDAAQGCNGLSLVLYGLPPGSPGRAVRTLESRCAGLRTILDEYARTPPEAPGTRERRRLADHAKAMLQALDVRPAVAAPEPIEQVRPLDPTWLQDYVRTLVSGPFGGDAYEDAVRGVIRFSTPATYQQLRTALDNADEQQAEQIGGALTLITFREDGYRPPGIEKAYWDAWWTTHARRTRRQWAEEVLSRHERVTEHNWWSEEYSDAARAAVYLMHVDGTEARIRALSRHESWRVRIAASVTLAEKAPRRAGELLLRELRGRYIRGCESAVDRLQQLTNQRYLTDCLDPSQREQAVAYWTGAVEALPRP